MARLTARAAMLIANDIDGGKRPGMDVLRSAIGGQSQQALAQSTGSDRDYRVGIAPFSRRHVLTPAVPCPLAFPYESFVRPSELLNYRQPVRLRWTCETPDIT